MKLAWFFVAGLTVSHVAVAQDNATYSQRTANNGQLVMQDVPEIPEQVEDALNQYQNVRSAPFRSFTEDGNSVYISTRFGDVSQLHRVDSPGGARHQLTFFPEPVGSVARQPGSNNLAFTMDSGGNEYAQIFLLNPATGKHQMLTDGESRNGAMVWSHDGDWLAFQSTRRNGASNDIWMLNPNKPDEAKMVLASEDGSWWGPSDFSKDNSELLVQQYISASDSRVYIQQVGSDAKTLIAGGDDNVSVNFALGFDKSGSGVFLVTNQKSEFRQLAHLNTESGELNVITADIPWNVSDFAMSDDGARAAFTVNQDGRDTLYLLDTASLKYSAVDGLPMGLIGGLEMGPQNKKLALTLNTSKTPSDTFVLALKPEATAHGELIRWTYSEVGGLDTDTFVEPDLIRYESFDGREIPAFVYKPESEQPSPVVIYIHGGPEGQFRPSFASTFQLWAKELGIAVVAPNVRGSSGYGKEYINLDNGFKREDSVKDIGALLDWIATQPDLDASRVAVYGGSYGGYMVLASVVHYSDKLKAAVDIVGISNFVTFLKNTKDYRRDLRRVEYGDERDEEMRAFLERISPSNNVEKINVPMFVIQGENDPRVPVTEAEQIVEALRTENKDVWYMNALNEGHGYRKKENRDIQRQAVYLFLKEHLTSE